MYNRPRRYQHRRQVSVLEFLMPYLIIICIAVILVLLFNLWRAVTSSDFEEDAYMHVIDGSVQMKTWGTDSYFDLPIDALIMEGDEVRTSANAKVIVEFFDGTIMRMDASTHVLFNSLDNDNNEITIDLLEGALWFNQIYKSTEATDLKINLTNVAVDSNEASVFAVADNPDGQSARVFAVFDDEGLLVEVMNKDNDKVIEKEYLGIGQEIVFTDKVLEKYWAYQSPTVISALSDDFKSSAWYKWNLLEDEIPTEFQKYASSGNVGLKQASPEILEPEKGLILDEEEEAVDSEELSDPEDIEEEDEEEEAVDLGPLGVPAITTVSGGTQIDEGGFYNVTGNPAVLNGSISGAAKVIVNNYTLTKFKPGDTSWTYFANADYELMQEGENFYEVYAVDAEGNKSEIITVKVRYSPPAPVIVVEEVVVEDTEEVKEETTEE